jgi:hypothetical protein
MWGRRARTHTHTHTQRECNVFPQQRPFKLPHTLPGHAAHSTARRLVACVKSELEEGVCRERYGCGGCGHAGGLHRCPPEMSQPWKILVLANLFSYWRSRSSVLFRRAARLLPDISEKRTAFYLQGYESLNLLITRRQRRYVSSELREELTQLHAATTQNSWFHKNHSVETKTNVSLLLRIYLFVIILCSSFIMCCCCMIDFLLKNERLERFIIFGCQSSRMHKNIIKK